MNSNQPDNLVTAGTVGNHKQHHHGNSGFSTLLLISTTPFLDSVNPPSTVPAASHEKKCRQENDLASKPSPTTIEANNDTTTSTRPPLQQPKLKCLSTTDAIGMYSITGTYPITSLYDMFIDSEKEAPHPVATTHINQGTTLLIKDESLPDERNGMYLRW